MSSVLSGTVALVTGASSGIGEATALSLAGEGATVVLAARRVDRLEALVGKITGDGGTALAVEADVTDPDQARAAVERAVSEYGRLDTLINNAGVMLIGPVVGTPFEQWQRMVDVNVLGVLHATHAALPHLLEAAQSSPRRVADVVNVSSVAGRVARSGNAVYALTKHGLGAFSEALRQEVTGRHLRVGLIEPGAVETELASHNTEDIQAMMAERFAGLEKLQAEDIAEAITFMVTRARHIAVNELLVRPTDQQG